jgi:hypothetical protein
MPDSENAANIGKLYHATNLHQGAGLIQKIKIIL